MDEFQERLRKEGIETSWQPIYNAGANPVPIRLRQADLAKPVVQELLRATFEILDPSAMPWSERHTRPPATSPATTPASDSGTGDTAPPSADEMAEASSSDRSAAEE